MTICFDLRALQIGHENRGIGMYLRSLLENIEDTGNKFIFYLYDSSNPIEDLDINVKFDYEIITTSFIDQIVRKPSDLINIYRSRRHNFKELVKIKPDVFVQFDHSLGIPKWKGVKTVVVGYDLIPLIMKNQYNPSVSYAWRNSNGLSSKARAVSRSIYYRSKYSTAYDTYKKADHVLCISNFVARSFVDLLGISKNKISPIPLAPVMNDKAKTFKKPTRFPCKPYLFYIGGTDVRKQINHLIKTFNIIRGRGLNVALVLAGNEFKSVEQMPDILGRNAILESAYSNDIHAVGFVNEGEKKYFYNNTYAFIFSSSYEGFGLPVIEAMSDEAPVVTYRNSSITETGGSAAIYVADGDYVSLANAVLSLDSQKRTQLIEAGLRQAAKFNWKTTAKKTMDLITNL